MKANASLNNQQRFPWKIKINEQKNSITKLSKLCLGALNAIDRIESNIESEKENARKVVEQENFHSQVLMQF